MGYDRIYSREEVHQMLYLSERRPRPAAPPGQAHPGHAISRHTEQREDKFDRRRSVPRDSTFTSRKGLVLATKEALHSPQGQAQLATLNAHAVATCKIAYDLVLTRGKVAADVVEHPFAKIGGRRVPAAGPSWYGPGRLVTSVVLIVDKAGGPESWAPLHLQTVYPQGTA